MLLQRYGEHLEDRILPLAAFHPYPRASERERWEGLPAALRAALIAVGEAHRGQIWPPLPATLFMEYHRSGNRSHYERESFARRAALAALVLAECAEGQGRFLDDIINGIWAICEESFWGVPAHNDGGDALPDAGRPYFDLFAGESGALLAATHYLLAASLDGVSPRISARIRTEVDRRILTPFLGREDFWWMGLQARSVNNWNPWCTSNALAAGMLLEPVPARRTAIAAKAMRCLDRFIDTYPVDGGCDEGTSYWDRAGGALFDALEWLRTASADAIDVYAEPLIADIGRFLHRAHIAGDWFVNFADGGARVHIAADLVHRYGLRIGDPDMAALGASAHARRSAERPHGSLPRLLPALFHRAELDAAAATASPPHLRDAWLGEIQVMTARERAGSPLGLYVAAKGGHNGESHNHNDVGQFLLYWDGRPVIVDAGVGTYTAKTFGPDRYALWTMRSAYHNLPTVRGIEQHPGSEFRARDVLHRADANGAELSLDIAGAYPPEAGIAFWRRCVRLLRQGQPRVEVVDDFRLEQPTADVRLTLLLAGEPVLTGEGRADLARADRRRLTLEYDGAVLDPSVEALDLDDPRLSGVWGERLWRLTLRSRREVAADSWRLLVEVRPD